MQKNFVTDAIFWISLQKVYINMDDFFKRLEDKMYKLQDEYIEGKISKGEYCRRLAKMREFMGDTSTGKIVIGFDENKDAIYLDLGADSSSSLAKEETKRNSSSKLPESVKACFRFTSDFVKEHVQAIVKEFYMDKSYYLAIIERTFYDHYMLLKSNNHTLFIRALIDWGVLPEDIDIKKIANCMATKFKKFPKTGGYKEWDENDDRTLCIKIGKKLPESMKYIRKE